MLKIKCFVHLKMRRLIAIIAINSLVFTKSVSINYCGARMCGNTDAHTFCQYTEGPSPRCTGYIKAPLSDDEKVRVMARLNRRRSDAASGRLRGLHPAGNMLKLRWVEELAREAQRWADQCRPPGTPEEHDVCRDLYSISVGQCVASVVGEAPGLRVESMIDMWYMQSMLYKGNATYYVPPPTSRRSYGDFGQIMWSKTYMVGCGRSRFMSPMGGRLRSVERLVCNLSPRGPLRARPLWSPAAPASACSSRSRPDHSLTALCTYQSDLNETDDSMALEEHMALNTVLEIEANESLNYHGSLDELFLTKIAVVTIENSVTIPYYNSVQKRDIPDTIALEDAKLDVYQIVTHKEVLQNQSASRNLYQVIPIGRIVKKKLNLIGRPKTYNMDDLNDIVVNLNAENDHAETNSDTKNEKELYAEYGLLEAHDDNATVQEPTTTANETLTFEDNESEAVSVTYDEMSSILNNITMKASTSESTTYLNTNEYLNRSVNRPQVNQNAEDYINDPETVRELQEALDRMEQTLEPTLSSAQGKVRRDLRDLPSDINVDLNRKTVDDGYRASPEEIERNKTLQRGPMMNMVLKYIPYLKHYESDILGKGASGSECICPSFVIVLSLCL